MSVPFELGLLTFGLTPHGWGKYRYCLDHESGRIGVTSSRRLLALRIPARAEFLQVRGPGGTVTHFEELLGPLVENLAFSVARMTCSATSSPWSSAPKTCRLRVLGQRLHDVRGGPGLHRLRLRLESHPARRRPN
jgi:hypothetical protein